MESVSRKQATEAARAAQDPARAKTRLAVIRGVLICDGFLFLPVVLGTLLRLAVYLLLLPRLDIPDRDEQRLDAYRSADASAYLYDLTHKHADRNTLIGSR